jgi:hypothetical protein
LAENWFGTDFRYYHGTVDPGPMRPAFVHALDAHVDAQKIPHQAKWYEAGHDLLYLVHRHGNVYKDFESSRRQQRPREVHVISGDYRAARQHWLEITRFEQYPQLARLRATVEDDAIAIACENVLAFAIDVRDLPASVSTLSLRIDGVTLALGERAKLGHRVHLVKREGSWRAGFPEEPVLAKRPGVSGPITDAYFGRMVHVYGSARPEHTAELKKLAEKGARGWPLWLWTVEQEVLKDSEVTPEIARDAHLVLYGTPGDNSVLDRVMSQLPVRVETDAVVVGDKRYGGAGVGTRFIYPNPEAPERYIVVQSGPSMDGVRRGHNLPDFVPDYVVYDGNSASVRPRLVPARAPLARGFFDRHWQLPH